MNKHAAQLGRIHATTLAVTFAVASIAVLVYSVNAKTSVEEVDPAPGYPIDYKAYTAAAPERDEQQRADMDAELLAAQHGLEPEKAGLHLIRPTNDPLWKPMEDWGSPSGGFHWRNIWVRYADVEYQNLLPAEFSPPINTGSCLLSLRRIFVNGIATPSYEADGTTTYRVKLTFDRRQLDIVGARLTDLAQDASGGRVDWFGVSGPATSQRTEMRVVVVSDDIAYVPFSASVLVANDVAPVTVEVAKGLPESEAAELVQRLSRP